MIPEVLIGIIGLGLPVAVGVTMGLLSRARDRRVIREDEIFWRGYNAGRDAK